MKTSLRRLIAALAINFVASASAQPIQVNNVGLEIAQTRYFLNADFRLDLTAPLLEALNNGVSLGFLVQFQLTRPRWYWFDEKTASEKLELRLSYLPLAQQYRLASGTLYQNFPTLAEALEALGRVHGWPVLGQDQVDNGRAYIAAVRLRLDPAQLPTPFRVSAVTTRTGIAPPVWNGFRFTPYRPIRRAPGLPGQ